MDIKSHSALGHTIISKDYDKEQEMEEKREKKRNEEVMNLRHELKVMKRNEEVRREKEMYERELQRQKEQEMSRYYGRAIGSMELSGFGVSEPSTRKLGGNGYQVSVDYGYGASVTNLNTSAW